MIRTLDQRSEMLLTGALLASAPLAGMLAVRMPFAFAGVLLGGLLLAALFMSPLAVVAFLMLVGPVDLSFVTGGLKGLFASMGGLDMNGIRLIGVCLGLGITALAVPRTRTVLLGRWGIVYVLFLVWALTTLVRSPNQLDGLRTLLKLAYPLLIFVTVVGMADTRAELDRLYDCALVGAALIVFVLNPFYAAAGGYGIYDSGHVRIRGVGLHENPFSFYLLISLYMAFTRLVLRRQWRYLILSAALVFWMVLTLTRITFLAAAVGFTFMALYGAFMMRSPRMLLATAVGGVAIAVPLVPVVYERTFGFVGSPAHLLDLARNPMVLYESINWQGREVAWPIVFAAFLGAPWAGLGLGSSVAIMREYFPPSVGELVHNEYLRLAVDTGMIGLVLFAAALTIWLIGIARAHRVGREYALPALAGLLSWAVISITDNAFDYYTPLTQYVGLLAGASIATLSMDPGEENV